VPRLTEASTEAVQTLEAALTQSEVIHTQLLSATSIALMQRLVRTQLQFVATNTSIVLGCELAIVLRIACASRIMLTAHYLMLLCRQQQQRQQRS
jgi:hypothetical protein